MNRHRDWSVAVVLMVCIFGALAFLALLNVGEDFICTHGNGQKPTYCEPSR